MRQNLNLDGEGLSNDTLAGARDIISFLDRAAPAWLADPKVDDTSGMIFLLVDLVLPLVVLCLLVLFRALFPRCQPDPEAQACPTPKVLCPDNVCRSLAWWYRAKVGGFVRTLAHVEVLELIEPSWSMGTLSWVLGTYGTSAEGWGDNAKKYLLEELSTGRARLLHKARRPIRAVDLVLLVVEYGPWQHVLQEEIPKGVGMFDPLPERTPSTRRRLGESVSGAAERCLAEKLKIPGAAVRMREAPVAVFDAVEDSASFPGLVSLVRKFLVHVEVVAADPAALQVGLDTGRVYGWVPVESSTALLPHLSGSPSFGRHQSSELREADPGLQETLLDGSFKAVLPWTESDVAAVLRRHGVADPRETFGRPLEEMAVQLSAGRYSLALRKSDGSLVCVQDVLTLLLTTPGGCVLVDTATSSLSENQELPSSSVAKLPCVTKLANEDPWITARRIAFSQLGIHAGHIEVDDGQAVQQVSPGAYALEKEEAHLEGQGAAHWVFREWVVLSHVPNSYSVMDVVSAPPSG